MTGSLGEDEQTGIVLLPVAEETACAQRLEPAPVAGLTKEAVQSFGMPTSSSASASDAVESAVPMPLFRRQDTLGSVVSNDDNNGSGFDLLKNRYEDAEEVGDDDMYMDRGDDNVFVKQVQDNQRKLAAPKSTAGGAKKKQQQQQPSNKRSRS